jgi:LCP family protein required for cell wall assembly
LPETPWNMRRIALTVAGVLVAGAAALVLSFALALHRSPFDLLEGRLEPTPQQVFHKDHILVLLEGLDYNYTDNDIEFTSGARSDVIKVADLDFVTHKIYILDVPRDMEATLPNGEIAKINQAQADGGVKEAQAVIAKWLGVPGFDKYVVLRPYTTKDLINAIGGIDLDPMNSDALMHQGPNGPIDYDDNWGHLHIHFKPGMQHLNGEQAVAYARFRHDWCSDPCRIMRQDQVIHAALTKIKSDKLNTLMHLTDLLNVFQRDVQTNLTQPEVFALATAFVDMPKSGLVTAQVPAVTYVDAGGMAGDVSIPDQVAKAQMVQKMLLDPPRPTREPDAAALAVAPWSVRVDVENGSGVPGAAARVAAALRKQGFAIASVGDAPSTTFTVTEVHAHSKIALAGERVLQALGEGARSARVLQDTSAPAHEPPSDVTVIVGQDLAGSFNAADASGTN